MSVLTAFCLLLCILGLVGRAGLGDELTDDVQVVGEDVAGARVRALVNDEREADDGRARGDDGERLGGVRGVEGRARPAGRAGRGRLRAVGAAADEVEAVGRQEVVARRAGATRQDAASPEGNYLGAVHAIQSAASCQIKKDENQARRKERRRGGLS